MVRSFSFLRINVCCFAIIATGLSACEMVVDVDIPPHKPRLAMHLQLSNIQPDTPNVSPMVFLGKSQSILEPYDNWQEGVSDAIIQVKDESGTVVEAFTEAQFNPGYYIRNLDFLGIPGHTYTLHASAPGFDPIEASTRMPDLVPIHSASFTQSAASNPDQFKGTISMTFNDNGGQQNYYSLYLQALDQQQQPMPSVNIYYDDEGTGIGNNVVDARFFNTFSDQTINGQTITINNRIEVSSYNWPGQQTTPYFLQVQLRSISRDEYLFQKSREAYWDAHGNPFAEPVRIYTNMKNGFGVFGSSTESTFVIPL